MTILWPFPDASRYLMYGWYAWTRANSQDFRIDVWPSRPRRMCFSSTNTVHKAGYIWLLRAYCLIITYEYHIAIMVWNKWDIFVLHHTFTDWYRLPVLLIESEIYLEQGSSFQNLLWRTGSFQSVVWGADGNSCHKVADASLQKRGEAPVRCFQFLQDWVSFINEINIQMASSPGLQKQKS